MKSEARVSIDAIMEEQVGTVPELIVDEESFTLILRKAVPV